MIGASLINTTEGPAIKVQIAADYDRVIPLALIASYRELLGIDDPAEVVDAIMHVRDNGEPDPDTETGANVWTEPYALLRLRERAREDEMDRAVTNGEDTTSALTRSSQAAYEAVHIPVRGEDCAMDLCRADTRKKLGLPNPAGKCGEQTRLEPAPVPTLRAQSLRVMRPAGGKAEVADLLADQSDTLLRCTQDFLHGLSGHEEDFVTPPDTAQPKRRLATPDEILAKYQEAP